ncbi:MAG: hypothetical protein AABW85_03860 [archaeon]
MEKPSAAIIAALFFAALALIALFAAKTVYNMPTTGLVTIADIDPNDLAKYFENGELKPEYVTQVNKNIDSVPQFVVDAFAGGKTNVTVLTTDGQEQQFNVSVSGKQLLGAKEGRAPDADAEVKVNEGTIEKIANSKEPIEALAGAINSGEIQYKAVSPKAGIKELFLGIISFFIGIIAAVVSFAKKLSGG